MSTHATHATRSRRLAALLTPIAAATLAIAAQAQTFGPPLNLSNSAAASGGGQVAVVAADVYTVWVDTPVNNKKQTRFAHSSNGGVSFGSPMNVLGARTGATGPQVAADGAYVYVARAAQTKPNGPTQVYFSASANHGMSFGPEIALNSPSNGAELVAIAAAGSSAHVLWSTPGVVWKLFVSTSVNGGASFAPAVDVCGAIGYGGQGASLRVLGANAHVAWSQWVGGFAEVYYSRSLDGGASFSTPVNLSNTAGQNSVFPQLALAGSNVYLGYRETEYRLIRSTDGGANFSAPVDVSSGHVDNHSLYGAPGLAASGAVLHYIWHDDAASTPGNYDVFHRSSTDGGENFGATTNLSASAPASFGIIAAEGLNAYVVWSENNGPILVRQSINGGSSFSAAVNVAAGGGAAFVAAQPAPAGVHVGWSDSTLGNSELFYRFGTTP